MVDKLRGGGNGTGQGGSVVIFEGWLYEVEGGLDALSRQREGDKRSNVEYRWGLGFRSGGHEMRTGCGVVSSSIK